MNKQNKKTKSKRNERLDMRVSDEEKAIIKNYCKENHISITDLALKTIFNEMKRNSFETKMQKQLSENAFYNYAVAYSTMSPAVKKMLHQYNKGGFQNV